MPPALDTKSFMPAHRQMIHTLATARTAFGVTNTAQQKGIACILRKGSIPKLPMVFMTAMPVAAPGPCKNVAGQIATTAQAIPFSILREKGDPHSNDWLENVAGDSIATNDWLFAAL